MSSYHPSANGDSGGLGAGESDDRGRGVCRRNKMKRLLILPVILLACSCQAKEQLDVWNSWYFDYELGFDIRFECIRIRQGELASQDDPIKSCMASISVMGSEAEGGFRHRNTMAADSQQKLESLIRAMEDYCYDLRGTPLIFRKYK